MTRAALAIAGIALAGMLLSAGAITMYAMATNTPHMLRRLITPQPPITECVVIAVETHAAVEHIIIPGTDATAPITGALHTYRRVDCGGVQLLVRAR